MHRIEVGAVDQLASVSLPQDEAGTLQRLQMKGERRRHEAHHIAYGAGRETLRAPFHERSIDSEAMLVRQRAQGFDDLRFSHGCIESNAPLEMAPSEFFESIASISKV